MGKPSAGQGIAWLGEARLGTAGQGKGATSKDVAHKKGDRMLDELTNQITKAIATARREPGSRETSLTITKLEEALLWWGQALQTNSEQARARAVGAPLERKAV